jgi:integrase
MPRKATFPPRITHHQQSGRDRCRVNGRDVYLGPHDSEESRRAYAELVARLTAGQLSEPPASASPAQTLVADVVAAWLVQEGPRHPEDGRELAQFRRSFAPLLALHGATPASSFGVLQLEEVQQAMASGSWMGEAERQCQKKRGIKHKGWAGTVVNARVKRVRRVWRWAERRGLVPEGKWANLCTITPLRRTDRRVRHTTRRRPCSFADLLAVARCAPPPIRAMLVLQWWSGMRPGEARALRRDEVDTSGTEWLYRPGTHKRAHAEQSRVVVLGPKARAVLRPWLARAAASGYVFPPSQKCRKGGRAFYSMTGYSQAVRRARIKAGVPDITAYLARHSCKQRVTRALGLDHARSVLGQKSLGTTADYGDQVDLELARAAARKLG